MTKKETKRATIQSLRELQVRERTNFLKMQPMLRYLGHTMCQCSDRLLGRKGGKGAGTQSLPDGGGRRGECLEGRVKGRA